MIQNEGLGTNGEFWGRDRSVSRWDFGWALEMGVGGKGSFGVGKTMSRGWPV